MRRLQVDHGEQLNEYEEEILAAGQEARERMILSNLRLVVSIAKKKSDSLDLSDRIQEGIFGLSKAVDRYDHTMGFRFSTYATWWIKQAIGRAADNQSRTIRLPVHVQEVLRQAQRIQRALERESPNTRPDTKDIAEKWE